MYNNNNNIKHHHILKYMLKVQNVITDYTFLDIGYKCTLFTTWSKLFDDIRLKGFFIIKYF